MVTSLENDQLSRSQKFGTKASLLFVVVVSGNISCPTGGRYFWKSRVLSYSVFLLIYLYNNTLLLYWVKPRTGLVVWNDNFGFCPFVRSLAPIVLNFNKNLTLIWLLAPCFVKRTTHETNPFTTSHENWSFHTI